MKKMFNFDNLNVDLDRKSLEQIQFLESNVMQLGAIGWMGYELKNRGAVVIVEWSRNQASWHKQNQVEINYLSKADISRLYPRDRELRQFVEEYNPQDSLSIAFVNQQNSLLDSYHLTLTVPVFQCYVLWLEQIAMLDVKK
jgi:tRNA A37 threonylcarbamoyladenosine biosynthesis protein TsaE